MSNQFVNPSFIAATGVPITYIINRPTINDDNKGKTSTGISPSIVLGNFIHFFSKTIIYPAKNPDTIPPRKPAPIWLDSIPPIIPGTIPGLSAIE